MKKFGDNKIMRIFAVHFLSSRQRLMDAEAEFLGFKAVRQQECQVRLAPPSENLTASGKLFFSTCGKSSGRDATVPCTCPRSSGDTRR